MAVEALGQVRDATPPVEPFTLVEAHLLAGIALTLYGETLVERKSLDPVLSPEPRSTD
jgi:hypothetical protein